MPYCSAPHARSQFELGRLLISPLAACSWTDSGTLMTEVWETMHSAFELPTPLARTEHPSVQECAKASESGKIGSDLLHTVQQS